VGHARFLLRVFAMYEHLQRYTRSWYVGPWGPW